MMKKLLKEYEAPLCDVVEVSLESAVLNTSTGESFDGKSDWDGKNQWIMNQNN